MEHKKYIDIDRLKPSFVDGFEKGDHIVIQEKIDGANASFEYDKENDVIQSFSRKHTLDVKNNLRGFWNYIQELDKGEYYNTSGLRVYSEWLIKHSVAYPQDKYQKMYVYDIYDTKKEVFLHQDNVKEFCNMYDLTYVPVFYEGEFISWEHIQSFVGKTELGGEYGEGVVVKNMTKLNNPNTRLPFYTKIVGEKFVETKGHSIKQVDPNQLEERQRVQDLTSTIVTDARVTKILHKFIDEGILQEDWDEKSMSVIAKNIPRAVYDDCIKEEPEIVSEIGEYFGKFTSSMAMKIVRSKLAT